MDKINLIVYPFHWGVADVFKNGILIHTINKFYDVTKDWIIEYETTGGSGIGWTRGKVIKKIFIGNCEFETIKRQEKI